MNLPWIILNKCQSIKFLIPLCCEIFFGTSNVSSFFFSKIHSVSISLLFTLRKLLEKAKNKISVMKTLWLTCVMTAVQMIKTPKNCMYSAVIGPSGRWEGLLPYIQVMWVCATLNTQRVWLLHHFSLEMGVDFAYFWLELGMVQFKGTTEVYEHICHTNSKWILESFLSAF